MKPILTIRSRIQLLRQENETVNEYFDNQVWKVYNKVVPILDENSLEYFSRSADQTRRLGMRLGALLKIGQSISLSGELGWKNHTGSGYCTGVGID